MEWWTKIMPLQGASALDDLLLGKEKDFLQGGLDPEQQDRVMLLRERVSRIFYLRKFLIILFLLKCRLLLTWDLGVLLQQALVTCIRL